MPTKRCARCRVSQAVDQFGKANDRPDGRHPYCRSCRRAEYQANRERYRVKNAEAYKRTRAYHLDYRLRKSYGLSSAERDAMVVRQGGACASCGDVPTSTLNVDHDHVTGQVRDLLCARCNTALGLLLESPGRIEALARYLRRHQEVRACP